MKKKFVLTCLIAISSITLSACSFNIGSSDHSMMDGKDLLSIVGSDYDATALMFASMMIPHHEQALVMADMALEKSNTPELLQLAAEIKAAQAPEIAQMQTWLETVPGYEPGHMGHDAMQGMLSASQIEGMRSLTGIAFDKAFLLGMIAHHEGALVMARMISSSENEEVKALGEAIITSQTAEIDLMKTMISKF